MKESKPQSKFPTMQNSAATTARNASAEGTGKGKLVPKKGAQAADPTVQAKPARKNARGRGERGFGITTSMPSWSDPQIAPTQSNGRMFTSAVNRTAPNFQAGIPPQQ
jgi:hypothetical protein